MRAQAAAFLRSLQDARIARPSEPCAVLVGEAGACEQARVALGGSRRDEQRALEEGGCMCGESLNGVFLVEPPEVLHEPAEVTELATFLRGLQDAHGLLLALDSVKARALGTNEPVAEELADVLSLVCEFYKPEDWQSFVTVVLIGAPLGSEAAMRPDVCRALRRHRVASKAETSRLPKIVCLDAAGGAHELLAHLRTRRTLACEPLQASTPLISQYRAIRQQLKARRPPSSHSSSATSRTSPSSRAPGRGSLSPQAQPRGSACRSPVSAERLPASRRWTVMVFGKTGAGKSHLANLLVGFQAFDSGDSLASVTKQDSVRKAISSDGSITVLDTIGFGDTQLPPETVVRSLRDTALEAPEGIDALLFVLKKERVSAAEQETLAYVTQLLFGPGCLQNLYMVVTHAGRLAKDLELRGPWLREQADASPPFAAMLATLGTEPIQRLAFVENSDPADAEDVEDRLLAEKRRKRALEDVLSLLERQTAPPYRHSIMRRAGELQAAHLEEMRRELRQRVEDEVRQAMDKDRGALEEERLHLHAEIEGQRRSLQEQEEELQRRFENQWAEMRSEFQQRARELARGELEPLAQDIVEKTEKKASGRRCTLM